MSMNQDEFRAALHAVAGERLPDGIVPVLVLPAVGQDSEAPEPTRRIRRRRPVRPTRQRAGWPRLLAPLAAAAAVIAVAAGSLAIATRAHTSDPGSSAAASPLLRSLPRYYMTLVPNQKTGFHAVIRNTITGATLATIRPPRPYPTFVMVTGAADDRTFVLAAEFNPLLRKTAAQIRKIPKGYRITEPFKLFGVRFDPAQGTFTMAPLPIPQISPHPELSGLALSPDGTRLAVAFATGLSGQGTLLRIYSLATGAVKAWHAAGEVGEFAQDQDAMSWPTSGSALAFSYNHAQPQSPADSGMWLLNTATASGDLLGDSRLAVSEIQKHDSTIFTGGILSPDATKFILSMFKADKSGATTEFEKFSAATGRPVGVLYPLRTKHTPSVSVMWSNSTGSVLVVQAPVKAGDGQSVYGVLRGNRLIPIPGSPATQFGTAFFAF